MNGGTSPAQAGSSLSRRTALRGAGLAVGAVWVAPVIQMISMDSAAAASAAPSQVSTKSTTASSSYQGDWAAGESALPKTGSSDSTVGMAAVGAGAVVAGTAAVVAARRWKRSADGVEATASDG